MDYIPLSKLKEELLSDPQAKAEYDRLEPEFAAIEAIILKRIEKKMTQKALAEKLHTKQSAISRLESGLYNPSLEFLKRVARALGYKLRFTLEPV